MVILITGGASGLGKEITFLLNKSQNHEIYITYNKTKIDKDYLNIEDKNCIYLNFRDHISIEKLVNLIPKLNVDVLINNAYDSMTTMHFRKMDRNILHDSFRINVLPTLLITQAAINNFRKNKFGKIINILSSSIISKPKVGWSEYIANKSYLLSMSRSWAVEYSRFNITSNSVSPSFMETNFTQEIDSRIVEKIKSSNPLKKFLKTKEVAQSVEYFVNCSQQINGQNLVINNNLE